MKSTLLANLILDIWLWLTATPLRLWLSVGILVGLVICIAALNALVRRLHDRTLEEERRNEIAPPPAHTMRPEVSVVREEQVVEENATLFMPVPTEISSSIDFVSRIYDGVRVTDSVRFEEVNHLLSDEDACRLTAVVDRSGEKRGGPVATVYLDTLSDRFSADSYVNLRILKQAGIAPRECQSMRVYARGTLRKPLMIEADGFSSEAVKMISLSGGRAILIRT